ncbi:MAG: hypothetical protein PUG60_00270 [Lachnospiraceae bacterium]|nr:hypothetical protein [Lachnospiraceae bacterium]
MSNADDTALDADQNIFLDNDIFSTAENLERLLPVMLTFSDKDGKTIAYANLSYDLLLQEKGSFLKRKGD